MARDSAGCWTSCHTAASDSANEPAIAPHATAPDAALLRRRPRLAFTRKPSNGRSGISRSITKMQPRRHEDTKTNTKKPRGLLRAFVLSWSRQASPFQAREGVWIERLLVAEQGDHDRQGDGGLRRPDRHHEEHDD